jgi:tyrosinase
LSQLLSSNRAWRSAVPHLTRRHFLQGLAAAPLVFAAARPAHAAAQWIRRDIATPAGEEMLAIYADAIRAMQQLGPENPSSWMWWWYTHFVDGTTDKASEITRIFGDTPSPLRSLAEESWNTCQSHAGQNSSYFLPWHRMYTWYMERMVRKVTGRADFAMPYWDYTNTDPAKCGVLPVQFRLPDDPVFGVLYRPNRTSLANTGQPIHLNQAGTPMNIDDAMAKTSYNTVGSVQGFCRAIDSGIHGRIHTLVGNSRGMGGVPYAGNDPLFFVHHANVDRMWASWNRNGNKNPTDATTYPWITTSFVMADENGVRSSRQVRNLFSALQLGYDYDVFFPRPPAPATTSTTTLAAKSAASSTKVASAQSPANLGASVTTVKLLRLSTASATDVLGLDTDNRRALLVLRKLHTWKQPGVLYHVYLSATPTAPLDASQYVGNINFFDAEFHDHGGGSKLDEALGENFYSFDVTPLLQGIAKKPHASSTRDALFVRLVPGGKPQAGANAMVAQIELVRQ